MRILAINPRLRPGANAKYLPVGLASVLTYLKTRGYECDLLDVDIEEMDDAVVEARLADGRYEVVLVGSIVTHYRWIKWLTWTVRRHMPEAKIVVGNSVAGSIPELFLDRSAADIAVIGEGEITTWEALEALRNGTSLADVPGLAFRARDGAIVVNPRRPALRDVDAFPMIDWSQFDVEKYFTKSVAAAVGDDEQDASRIRVMPVVTARGCVFRCTFCHHVFWNDPYRPRSAEHIVAEVRRNMDAYGATYITFWDDLSFATLGQAERLAETILAEGLKFCWNASARVDLFGDRRKSYDERLAVALKMKASGCVNLGFSLESGNEGILRAMNKRVDNSFFAEQVKLLQEAGISCSTSVVFGYPQETPETIKETFDRCYDAGIYPSIGYLLPLPGTGMYRYAREHRFITDEDAYLDAITERQDLCLNMTAMSDDEVQARIKEGAEELNRKLKLGLNEETLIKTGGYRRHLKGT